MYCPLKIADVDLSFFTGENTRLVLTAKESEHGYDYDVTYYSDSVGPVRAVEKHCVFYDQPTAGNAVAFMAAKIKETLG